jgi:hypothetical protein
VYKRQEEDSKMETVIKRLLDLANWVLDKLIELFARRENK